MRCKHDSSRQSLLHNPAVKALYSASGSELGIQMRYYYGAFSSSNNLSNTASEVSPGLWYQRTDVELS